MLLSASLEKSLCGGNEEGDIWYWRGKLYLL